MDEPSKNVPESTVDRNQIPEIEKEFFVIEPLEDE